jgi:hypothetical protein
MNKEEKIKALEIALAVLKAEKPKKKVVKAKVEKHKTPEDNLEYLKREGYNLEVVSKGTYTRKDGKITPIIKANVIEDGKKTLMNISLYRMWKA